MAKRPTKSVIRAAARRLFHDEGTCEVDEGAKVSRSKDTEPHGAYVQAWVWVDFGDIEEEDRASSAVHPERCDCRKCRPELYV
jgi:hypothetical protein